MSTTPVVEWAPNGATLKEILNLLQRSFSADTAVQQDVTRAAQHLFENVEAANYLIIIFADLQEEPVEIRQQAGLLLKNFLTSHVNRESRWKYIQEPAAAPVAFPHLPSSSLVLVREKLLHSMNDPQKIIRLTAGTLITTIVTAEGFERWPQALAFLVQLIDHTDESLADGAFDALSKICEDELSLGSAILESSGTLPNRAPFLHWARECFIPKVLLLIPQTAHTSIKSRCINCLNIFASHYAFAAGEPLEQLFDHYWQALGTLAKETAPDIRLPVVTGMTQVIEFNEMAILCNVENVFSFIVECVGDAEYKVRLEALDFFPSIIRVPSCSPAIVHSLPKLLPKLVENTRYSEWDFLQVDTSQMEADNADVPDSAQDLQPRFHKNDDDFDFDSDEGLSSNKSLWGEGWTVRKAAALSLDILAAQFQEHLLPHVLPLIEKKLLDSDWLIRESAVLSLGAISLGCMEGLSPFIPKVLDLLLQLCDDTQPLLRSISVWCISRFSRWVCYSSNRDVCLKPLLAKVLTLSLDKNKRVQEAACSAFATIEEEARLALVPYLPDISRTLSTAFTFYQAKNLLILYDAVGCLADAVGPELRNDDIYPLLMKPLMGRWQKTQESDFALIALFECLTCIAGALQEKFSPYASEVTQRCVMIMNEYLTACKTRQAGQGTPVSSTAGPPIVSRELFETTVDLLSAIVEALGPDMLSLLSQPGSNVIPLIDMWCTEPSCQKAHSSTAVSMYALIGRLAAHCAPLLISSLSRIFPQLISHLVHGSTSVCNNAAWAIGELVLKVGEENIAPFASHIARQLGQIIMSQQHLKSLLQNACYTLSRVGYVCPAEVAPSLSSVLAPWCRIMAKAPNEKEKILAFHGMCRMLDAKHAAAVENVGPLLEAIGSLYPKPYEASRESDTSDAATPDAPTPTPPPVSSAPLPPPNLSEDFRKLCHWLQSAYPAEWTSGWGSTRLETQHSLTTFLLASSVS